MSGIRYRWLGEFPVDYRRRGFDDGRPWQAREAVEAERFRQHDELRARAILNVICELAGWTAQVVQFDLDDLGDVATLREAVDLLEGYAYSLGRMLDKRRSRLCRDAEGGA